MVGYEAFKVGVHRHGETGVQLHGPSLGEKLVEAIVGHQVGEVHGATMMDGAHPTGADYTDFRFELSVNFIL